MNSYEFEEWRPIKGYEGLYEVSNYGRVKSLDRIVVIENQTHNGTKYIQKRQFKGQILKQKENEFGYLHVFLSNKGYTYPNVHNLVADAFIPNKWKLPEVNHKDENKHNNCVWNLEWCTSSYNKRYGTANKRRIETRNKNKSYHHQKTVGQFTLEGVLIATFVTAGDAAKQLNLKRECIRDCCLGRQKTAYGYVWKYLTDLDQFTAA